MMNWTWEPCLCFSCEGTFDRQCQIGYLRRTLDIFDFGEKFC